MKRLQILERTPGHYAVQDVEWGKVEAGQSAGLVEEILLAAEIMKRLVQELEQARRRLASL